MVTSSGCYSASSTSSSAPDKEKAAMAPLKPYYKQLMTYSPGPVPDWKLRLKRAWSPRFVALVAISQGMSAVWPNLGGVMDPWTYNILGFTFALLAGASIFVKQEGFHYGK